MARAPRTDAERISLGRARLYRNLRRLKIATRNTLEMKISEAGPFNQRIDPLPLMNARKSLMDDGQLIRKRLAGSDWFHLRETPENEVAERLAVLQPIQDRLQQQDVGMRIGQALEIAVFQALSAQDALRFLGHFDGLDDHDDSTLYSKEEPPLAVSGRRIPGQRRLDFIAIHPEAGPAGIEVKNVREWLYFDRPEVKDLLCKCCHLDAVPVLIARRIPFVTFKLLNACGAIVHETYHQRYPRAEAELAELARDKNLLGYHDVQLGNDPDGRLIRFITVNLPVVLPRARVQFTEYQDLVWDYAVGGMGYDEFAARVRRRTAGTNEDFDTEPPEA